VRLLAGRPREFFGRMAAGGGVVEPLAMFWLSLGLLLVTAFAVSVSCGALPQGEVGARVWQWAGRVTGLLLLVFPVTCVVAALVVAGVGSVYYGGASLVGEAGYEATISAVLYIGAGKHFAMSAGGLWALAASLVVHALSAAGGDVPGWWPLLVLLGPVAGVLAAGVLGTWWLISFHRAKGGKSAAGAAGTCAAGLGAVAAVFAVLGWTLFVAPRAGRGPRAPAELKGPAAVEGGGE
jgi:hypothetical protein